MQRANEIAETATAWLIRLEREATPELWEELQQWLEAHPRHRAEFIRQRTAWNRCDKLKMLRPADGTIDANLLSNIEFVEPEDEYAPAQTSPPGSRERFGGAGGFLRGLDLSRRGWLAAAAVTGLAVLGAWYLAFQGEGQSYQTAIGSRREIALSDGSTVDLNTDSQVRVRMTGARRDIILQRGEALFHVAHDAKRPFFVTAETTVVRAVGTAFTVRIREENRVEVLVTEGRIALGTPAVDSSDQPLLPASATAVSIDEDAAVNHGRVTVKRMRSDEVARKLAWTDGHLSFQGETLREAVGEFNRYNLRHLSIADPSILEMSVGGEFSSTDPDSFVAALEHSFHVIAIRATDSNDVRLIAAPDLHSGNTMSSLEDLRTAR